MGLYPTKNLHKKIANAMKRQPMEWEKIYVNHISGDGLICKIYKEFI